jgi:predicted nuclease of restriction endonuclease-like (RecB) superfamily
LAAKLTLEFGSGWSAKTLQHCLRSAETFSEEQIISAVRRQLSWTHLKSIMYQDSELKRSFYLEMCAIEHWSTRILDEKIDGALYERTALSRKPEDLIKAELQKVHENGELTPDLIFKSSYILDFLGLEDTYSETELEDAILNEIHKFIKELGTEFAFLGRQMRFTVDGTDYKIDLLFYHRTLHRLIAVDLKLGKFKPAYEGQMRLYLRWLDHNERKKGEESPIGLILCSEGNTEHIEYLMLEESNIRIAQYYTILPDVELLKLKLQRAVAIALSLMEERREIQK